MRVAAVIPTLNEAALAPALVRRLISIGFSEVIVADGGSGDSTPDLCRAAGAHVLHAPRGRGNQLAAGADASAADVLFFLHADSSPPEEALALIIDAITRRGAVGGAFRLRFDTPHPLLRLYSAASALNATLFTFGDQGFFIPRDIYEAIGGFRPWPLLEDVEIQRRLRSRGRFLKLPRPMTTSARRFIRDGVLRRQIKNTWIVVRFCFGACPFELSREYRPHDVTRQPKTSG